MRFLSPEEDFRRYTLDKIDGVLAKTYYFANLKEKDGSLFHWGLQKHYGPDKALEVLDRSFTQQLQDLLQERLMDLWHEAQRVSQGLSVDAETFLKKLLLDLEELAPARLTSLQTRHLKSTMAALSEVAAHQHSKSDPLQSQRPGQ